jgi:hypothetical protein
MEIADKSQVIRNIDRATFRAACEDMWDDIEEIKADPLYSDATEQVECSYKWTGPNGVVHAFSVLVCFAPPMWNNDAAGDFVELQAPADKNNEVSQ